MNLAYFDCFSGAGGDMLVGALIDAGADAEELRRRLQALPIDGYTHSISRTRKLWLSATRFHVDLHANASRPHRHLKDVIELLDRSQLSGYVRERAEQVFTRLARAEARVHGTTEERIHFHEVGAEDAIVDIVGTLTALEMLEVRRVLCSPLPLGRGIVQCAHGEMPIPAPATAELLKDIPILATHESGELTTPTAAALLSTLVEGFGPPPAMTLRSVGYGAGARETSRLPNVVRVLLGTSATGSDTDTEADEVIVLETNLDDASAEVLAHCLERLLQHGALDAYAVPIHMKKSRSGVVLTVVCEAAKAAELQHVLFRETTTFGVRRHAVQRSKLRRRLESVTTPYGVIRMKIGEGDGVLTAGPEFEDCKAAAEAHGTALRDVMTAAQVAWSLARQRGPAPANG